MVTYNLPPWLCMKRKFVMLTFLISSHKQPEKDINMYLELLVDDLKILWNDDVEMYDKYYRDAFTLKVLLL